MKELDQGKAIEASPAKTALAKKYLITANFFTETNRLEPFVAVYFIVINGWSEYRIGIISVAMTFATILFQIPAGDFIDKTSHKKTLTMTALLVASVTTASVVWTSNFWFILVAKMIEGIAAATFLPSLVSILFGICTTAGREIPQFLATNEISNKIGSFLFTASCGLIAYYFYPDIEFLFYLLGAGGIMAALFVTLIPSSAIDLNRARQLRREAVGEDDEIDSIELELKGDMKKNPEAISYSTLLRDKNILAFAVATFFYHFANAVVVLLVTQYIAIGDKRTSMVFTSVSLVLFYIFQAITNLLIRSLIEKISPRTFLIFAHLVLLVRCAVIVIMIEWWDNKYALTATQALDGIGAGIYDTLIPLLVGQLTEGTGRYGFTFGLILTCWRIGHAASLLLGEYIAYAVSYKVAFLTQGGIAIFSLLFFIVVVHLPPLAPSKTRRFSAYIDEEAMKAAFKRRVLASFNEIGGTLSIDGLYEVFKSVDRLDVNGTLDRAELKLFMGNASLASGVEFSEVRRIDLDILFDNIDVSCDGKISFIEFILYLEDVHGDEFSPQIKLLQDKARRAIENVSGKDFAQLEQLALRGLKEVFNSIDEDKNTILSKEELTQFLENEDVMSDVELDVFFRFMDNDDDGGITFEEFIAFLDAKDSKSINSS